MTEPVDVDEEPNYVFQPFKCIEIKCTTKNWPRPRSGHRVACDDVNLYCFGGYNPNSQSETDQDNVPDTELSPLFREFWSFCFATQKWRLHNLQDSIPEELASNAMLMTGNVIMIFGGTGFPFGERCSNNLYVYHIKERTGKLQLVSTSGQLPPGQYGQAVLCHDGNFYTIGGTNGFTYSCDVHKLDFRSLVWEPVYIASGNRDVDPPGRYRHELAFDGRDVFILGGGTAHLNYEFAEMPVFNIENRSWRYVKTKMDPSTRRSTKHPLPRKCHSVVQIDTPTGVQVFMAGGSDGMCIFADLWRLDLGTLQWTLIREAKLPKFLHFHSSAVTPAGCMYTFGGIELGADGYQRNNDLYKMWLCIPKLSEMCWEALLHYNPNLDNIERSALLNCGIPLGFVKRLE